MDEAGDLRRPPAGRGMRIGLFGGSFNPAHEGHRLVALQCLKRLALDRIWVMVSPGNPLKDRSDLAPLAERCAIAREVLDHPQIDITGFEAALGYHYTYETVDYLTTSEPDVHFVWLMGADSLLSFDRWVRWEEIARRMPMAIYARPGTGFRATRSKAAIALEAYRLPEERARELAGSLPPAWVYLRGITSTASSTAIRAARRSDSG